MRCSGCGASIPFSGSVCPHCLRDKAADKRAVVWACVFAPFGAFIGFIVGAAYDHVFSGAIAGALLAPAIAFAIWQPKRTKPPEVTAVPEPTKAKLTPGAVEVERRLADLDGLRKAGIVTDAEYTAKRQSILDAL